MLIYSIRNNLATKNISGIVQSYGVLSVLHNSTLLAECLHNWNGYPDYKLSLKREDYI